MMPMAPIGGFQVARLLGRSTAWKAMASAHPSAQDSAGQPLDGIDVSGFKLLASV